MIYGDFDCFADWKKLNISVIGSQHKMETVSISFSMVIVHGIDL